MSNKNLFRPANITLIVIAIIPWLLLIAHSSWFFPDWVLPVQNYDAILSWGLYHIYDIRAPLIDLADELNYYYARLAAILPGYIVFHTLPTLRAIYVLNIGYWYISVFSMYFTIRFIINEKVALLTAVLMGCYPLLLSSFSAGYNDGPAICYLSLTLFFLTLASKNKFWKLWLFVSGISFAGAIHSNFFVIGFTPIYAAYYFFVNRETSKNAFVTSLLFMCLGFAALTIFLGIINHYFGGHFFYFWSTLMATISFSQKPPVAGNFIHRSLHLTILGSRHLALPFLVLVGGVIFLWVNRARRITISQRLSYLFQFLYIILISFYMFWEIRGYALPLWYQDYAGYMIPIMFLALGSQLSFISELHIHQRLLWLILSVGIILVVLIRIIISRFVPPASLRFSIFGWHNPNYDFDYTGINLLILFIGLIVLWVFYKLQDRNPMFVLAIFIAFIASLYACMPDRLADRLSSNQILSVVKAKEIILQTPAYISQYRQRFWLDESSSTASIYKVIASFFDGYFDFFKWDNPDFEKLPDTFKLIPKKNINRSRPLDGEVLLILSDNPKVLDKARQSLGSIGLSAKWIKTEKVEQGDLCFFMTFIKIEEQKEGRYIPRLQVVGLRHYPKNSYAEPFQEGKFLAIGEILDKLPETKL